MERKAVMKRTVARKNKMGMFPVILFNVPSQKAWGLWHTGQTTEVITSVTLNWEKRGKSPNVLTAAFFFPPLPSLLQDLISFRRGGLSACQEPSRECLLWDTQRCFPFFSSYLFCCFGGFFLGERAGNSLRKGSLITNTPYENVLIWRFFFVLWKI